jgi:hypothetical protein
MTSATAQLPCLLFLTRVFTSDVSRACSCPSDLYSRCWLERSRQRAGSLYTDWLSDCRNIYLSYCRTIWLSNYLTVGLSDCRTFWLSNCVIDLAVWLSDWSDLVSTLNAILLSHWSDCWSLTSLIVWLERFWQRADTFFPVWLSDWCAMLWVLYAVNIQCSECWADVSLR